MHLLILHFSLALTVEFGVSTLVLRSNRQEWNLEREDLVLIQAKV
jgi:hypothetical protein